MFKTNIITFLVRDAMADYLMIPELSFASQQLNSL
jgi:hypothetical protein